MTASSPERLAELRRRWQAEPGSRLFLQLAEEYRRAERHGEAVEVLQAGLADHPNHVSAHVALGRARLAMGEAAAAVGSLERALDLDATNLVANKALVEAYLAQGEREKARQRLDLYRLLNDADPDVPELRRRIDGRVPPAPRARREEASPGALDAGDETAAGAAVASPAQEPPAGDPAADLLAEGLAWGGEASAESLAPPPAAVPSAAESDPLSAADRTDATADRTQGWGEALEEEPMRAGTGQADVTDWMEETGTGASGGDGRQPFGDLAAGGAARRYLEALGGEGLFPLPAAPPPPPPVTAPESLPEPRPAEVEALAAPAAPEPAAVLETAAEHEPAAAFAAPPPAAEPERPTVTLGQLYLDQGHFAEARRVFAALLDREPDHEVARRGLARADRELAAAGPPPVTAAELLRDAEPGQPARRAVLGAYLSRILRGKESRPSDVPR